ncbi:MAG: AI-2E family transporter [Alphaproteobacteria bacterium]|nr:AI-2E family transporter [Alphaproteobacteria bacterium]
MTIYRPSGPLERWQRISTIGLFFLAFLACLYVARDVFVPVFGAILLDFMFSPLIRPAIRYGIPGPIMAALVILLLLGIIGGATMAVSQPALDWVDRMPRISRQLEHKFRPVRESVEHVQKASAEVMNITGGGDKKSSKTVVTTNPGVMDRVVDSIPQVGIQILMMLVLLYFLLAAGDMFKEKTVRLMPTFRDKRAVVRILMTIEKEVSNYLVTIMLINAGLGLTIGLGLYAIGLKNAVFWGILAMGLNFIPYVGFLVGVTVVTIAAVLQFPDITNALMAPAVYSASNFLESSFITPSMLGRRFTINTVVMFLSIALWTWLWGVPGALMAVPLTVVLNVICSHVPALAPLHEYLSGKGGGRNPVIT